MKFRVVRLELPYKGAERVLSDPLSFPEARKLEIEIARQEPLLMFGLEAETGEIISRMVHYNGEQSMSKRLNKDEYLWHIAFAAAKRGTCDRFRGGCVVARNGILIASGYNGSAPGEDHCSEVGHELVWTQPVRTDRSPTPEDGVVSFGGGKDGWCAGEGEQHCTRTIHAEINAIINAAYLGVSIANCDWYLTGVPCERCSRAIARLKPDRMFMCGDLGCVEDDKNKVVAWWRKRSVSGHEPSPSQYPEVLTLEELCNKGVIAKGDINELTAGRDKDSSKG